MALPTSSSGSTSASSHGGIAYSGRGLGFGGSGIARLRPGEAIYWCADTVAFVSAFAPGAAAAP